MKEESSTIRGLQTGWLEAGDDNSSHLLFFIHGFPDTAYTFEQQIKNFGKRYKCVAPFLRGIEPSKKGDNSRYEFTSIALDHLEIIKIKSSNYSKKVTLIGHDIGAAHAIFLAELLQDKLHGLVLINGLGISTMGSRITQLDQMIKSWYIFFFQIPGISDTVLRFLPLRSLKKLTGNKNLKGDDSKIFIPLLHHYRKAFKLLPKQINKNLNLPTRLLVLWAKGDDFLVEPSQKELSKICKNFKLKLLHGSHWLHQEAFEVVNKEIEEFISHKET